MLSNPLSMTVATIISAWLIADFVAGVFHWIEDRYLRVDWPIIGEHIAKPNELHHVHPQAFLAGNYWIRNWTTIVPAMLGFFFAWLFGAPFWLLLVFVFLTQANEIHAFGHMQGKVPRWVSVLQETGILQSARHHALHHKSPNRVRYCVMSNLLNPILDAIGFWSALERVLLAFGIAPKSR